MFNIDNRVIHSLRSMAASDVRCAATLEAAAARFTARADELLARRAERKPLRKDDIFHGYGCRRPLFYWWADFSGWPEFGRSALQYMRQPVIIPTPTDI